MSVTKLKTVGSWRTQPHADALAERKVRGRVIIGLLTGADPPPDAPSVTPEPRKQRSR
jgi:hypothetical protein